MSLFKFVNGEPVELTPEEEAEVRAEWEANPPEPAPRLCTPLEFMDRFSEAEQAAIAAGAQQVPALNLWLIKLAGAREVDLDSPLTIAGLDDLVAAGLITAERKAEILA